jgi:hypothetical protein
MTERTREDGMQLLRAMEEEHAERREGQPLQANTPVIPEALARRVGLSSTHERFDAAVGWLEEQNAIEWDERSGEVAGKRQYLLTGRGLEMLREDRSYARERSWLYGE